MWAGLMGLPVFAIMALFFLFSIKNYRVRRSLQLAIIASLAIHLVIIFAAAVTNIFENRFEEPSQKMVHVVYHYFVFLFLLLFLPYVFVSHVL